jgi:hypothetical protein
VREYLKLQGRFSHLTEEDIEFIQENVDREWERLVGRAAMNKQVVKSSFRFGKHRVTESLGGVQIEKQKAIFTTTASVVTNLQNERAHSYNCWER